MRPLLVVLLASWAGWLLVRGLMRKQVPWIGLGLIALPVIVLGVTERQWSSAESAFSAAARRIAPTAAGVHCQRLGESFTSASSELGSVEFDADGVVASRATLSYDTCQRLATWWRSTPAEKARAPLEQVIAVHVLTHESVHLLGDMNEASTECRAMQKDYRTAISLGADDAGARMVVRRYWSEVYPDMDSNYVSGDCHENGPMDRTPNDGQWP